MNMIRRAVFFFVAAVLVGVAGCTCCSQVPVSLESINNWFLFHGPACRHYPNSCPPCPYIGGEACAHDETVVGYTYGPEARSQPDAGASGAAPKSPDEISKRP